MTDPSTQAQPRILQTAWGWWQHCARYEGSLRATRRLLGVLWEFARDSTPERRRQRFGDADYDWDYRVNTTSGAVGWRDRLLGQFHSAYQPTEPAAFHEMLDSLQQQISLDGKPLDYRDFTFIDLGSGKGRTLLMASDYPFRRIVGVELLPALHEIAVENLSKYKSESQKCFAVESICADATDFPFPDGPLVLYLFNPFPESGMRRMVANLEQTLRAHPRAVYVLYHNALLEHVLCESTVLRKICGAEQYSVFRA
ncbi:MAG TPA: class I SAM-dependent methyltransferase [Candidatus Sulfotelmatobacter sp.]|nr:class I SAM-dependent methyltransferase [Candidatus Sulfotelmatobacter sp.]